VTSSASAKPNILVCMDSFKGSVSAPEACRAAARGLARAYPSAAVHCLPIADGGEGTAEVLMEALAGERVPAQVTGPLLGKTVEAGYVWLPHSQTALVELASASGLPLLKPEERDPLRATTRGTGELIQAAIERGAQRILLAVGGSATNDAGMGCARALGWEFLDAHNQPLEEGGGALGQLARILPAEGVTLPPIDVLCDVQNPFTGPEGASYVYGPQKGASPEDVAFLDQQLQHFAGVVKTHHGIDLNDHPGAGAAGGMAGGAVGLLGACLVSGIDAIMDHLQIDEHLLRADWLITGEGKFDEQSMYGKVIAGLTQRAGKQGAQVSVLAGQVTVAEDEIQAAKISEALSIKPDEMPVEEAMARAGELIELAAQKLVWQGKA